MKKIVLAFLVATFSFFAANAQSSYIVSAQDSVIYLQSIEKIVVNKDMVQKKITEVKTQKAQLEAQLKAATEQEKMLTDIVAKIGEEEKKLKKKPALTPVPNPKGK